LLAPQGSRAAPLHLATAKPEGSPGIDRAGQFGGSKTPKMFCQAKLHRTATPATQILAATCCNAQSASLPPAASDTSVRWLSRSGQQNNKKGSGIRRLDARAHPIIAASQAGGD